MKLSLTFCLLLAALAGCNKAPTAPVPPPKVSVASMAGGPLMELLKVDDLERTYNIRVPATYKKENGPVPLVFAFSSFISGVFVDMGLGFGQLAEEKGFILVSPNALNGFGDAYTADHKQDLKFFGELFDYIAKEYNIDRNRVYLVGHSFAAGSISQSIAAEYGDRLAAMAVVGATAATSHEGQYTFVEKPKTPINVLFVNRLADPFIGYENDGERKGIKNSITWWAKQMGLPTKLAKQDGPNFFTLSTKGKGVEVKAMVYKKSDQNWPPSLNPILWKFFEDHPKK